MKRSMKRSMKRNMKNNIKNVTRPFITLRNNISPERFSSPIKADFVFSDAPSKYKTNSFETHKFTQTELFLEDWSDFLESVAVLFTLRIKHSISTDLKSFFDSLPEKFKKSHWSWYFSEVINTIDGYVDEMSNGDIPMSPPSIDSLNYFLRYMPHFAESKAKSYIDRGTGRFGVLVCRHLNVLDIQIREDSDIIFSYATPGRKNNFPSFSGEAVIIDSADAKQIRKILRIAFD
jgi:hypothetical protein